MARFRRAWGQRGPCSQRATERMIEKNRPFNVCAGDRRYHLGNRGCRGLHRSRRSTPLIRTTTESAASAVVMGAPLTGAASSAEAISPGEEARAKGKANTLAWTIVNCLPQWRCPNRTPPVDPRAGYCCTCATDDEHLGEDRVWALTGCARLHRLKSKILRQTPGGSNCEPEHLERALRHRFHSVWVA